MPDDLDLSDDALLRDSDLNTLRAGTKGGQRANKVETGIRMHHRPTGITVVSRTSRSQFRNRALALQELRRRIEERNKPVNSPKADQADPCIEAAPSGGEEATLGDQEEPPPPDV